MSIIGNPVTISGSQAIPVAVPSNVSVSAAVIFNKSDFELAVAWGEGSKWLPAWTADIISTATKLAALGSVTVTPVLLQSSNSPPSAIALPVFYAPGEQIPGTYPIALNRANIGNAVIPTNTASVQNDGNAPATQFIESTPSDQLTSAIVVNNDGSVTWKILSAGAQKTALSIVRGDATSGKAVITVGDSSDLSITTFQGTLGAAVTIPAANVASGFLAENVEIGTGGLQKFSMQNFDGWTGAAGILTSGKNIWFASDHNAGFLYNAYYDGTNYRQINGNGDVPVQILISKDAQSGTLARWNARYATGAVSTGAIITWGNWFCFAQMIDTGGATPTHIYTGTTAPSGQNAGDLWFDW